MKWNFPPAAVKRHFNQANDLAYRQYFHISKIYWLEEIRIRVPDGGIYGSYSALRLKGTGILPVWIPAFLKGCPTVSGEEQEEEWHI